MLNDIIEFQLYDWTDDQEDIAINDKKKIKQFIIHAFGRCENIEDSSKPGKSVYMKVKNFKPYFYTLLPNMFQSCNSKTTLYQEFTIPFSVFLQDKIKYNTGVKYELEYVKKADCFENGKKYWFVKLMFESYYHMVKYKNFLENYDININNYNYKCVVY